MKRALSVLFIIICLIINISVPAAASNTPSKYSSVDAGYVTAPKTQGKSYCCWAFAAISCLESDAIIQGYETNPDFSEAHLIWSVFEKDTVNNEYYVFSNNGSIYNRAGNFAMVIETLAKGCGLNDESSYPFYPQNLNRMGNYGVDALYTNNGYSIDSVYYLSTNDEIKSHIMEHGAAAAMIYSDEYSYATVTSGYNSYYHGDASAKVNHGITLVGWDDNYSKNNFEKVPAHDGAWLVKNSWGPNWGDNGYFWLSYDEPSIKNAYGFTVRKVNYDKVYSYNGVTYGSYTSLKNSFSYSNIFRAESDETLEHVSFYILNNNLQVKVSVVELNNNYTTPEDGKKIFNILYNYKTTGYQTVDTGDIELKAGKKYSVIIDMIGSECYCPTEYGDSTFSSFTASEGQSFIRVGSEWRDICEKGNAYINMYTKTANNEPVSTQPESAPETNEKPVTEDIISDPEEVKEDNNTETNETTSETEDEEVFTDGAIIEETDNYFLAFLSCITGAFAFLVKFFKEIFSFVF